MRKQPTDRNTRNVLAARSSYLAAGGGSHGAKDKLSAAASAIVAPPSREFLIDRLEDRVLLSAASPLIANPLNSTAPLSKLAGLYCKPFYHVIRSGARAHDGGAVTGLTPSMLRHAYGIDQITFNNGSIAGDGSGQTIAIVDAFDDPSIAQDLAQFDAAFGIPAPPSFVKVAGDGSSRLPSPDPGWAMEIALDVEWAHAVAPKANILLVEATDNSYQGLLAAVQFAAKQNGVSAVSMSWGGGEFPGENAYDSSFTTPSGHQGVTFIASSGDSGAPAGYPSASPNVLSVGGTTLQVDAQGNYLGESAWAGSGGGVSSVESQPPWQNNTVSQDHLHRTVPDVSLDADPASGVAVYDSYLNSPAWIQVGGTSLSSPCWAAIIAIVNQGRAAASLPSLDGPSQTLPMLYKLPPGDFHDIATGSNGYSAGPGYDLVTGLGSPVASQLVAHMAGSAPVFSISGASYATAGSAYSLSLFAVGAVKSWNINWGDGTSTQAGANASVAFHTFASVGMTCTITATAVDGSGGSHDAGSVFVSVAADPPGPNVDFTPQFESRIPASAAPGMLGKAIVRITDGGAAAAAGNTDITLYLSLDGQVDAQSVSLGTFVRRTRIASMGWQDFTLFFHFPRGMHAGRYYLIAAVNQAHAITESNYANNTIVSPRPISIQSTTRHRGR